MAATSGLARPVDLSYPSNRYAVAVMLLAGATGATAAFAAGEGWVGSLGWGVLAGGAAFLAWAIGREIDPDRTSTAALAAPLAAAAVGLGRPSLWGAAAVLLAARVLARTTGLAPKPVDLVVVVAVAAAAAASTPAAVPAGLVVAGALLADGVMPRRAPAVVAAAGVAGAAAVVTAGIVSGHFVPDPGASGLAALWFAAAGAVGLAAGCAASRPVSAGDYTGERLDGARVRAARVATAAALVGAAAWAGGPGVAALAPAGAALVALVIPRPRREPAAAT